MKKRWSLSDKTALITGGTRGIGRAIVEEFISLGADVFVISRNQKDIDELTKGSPGKIKGMQCNVTKATDRKKIFKRVSSHWKKLDILVNNAGTNTRKKTLENTEDDFDKLISLNLKSVFEMSKLFYPLLKKSDYASIVNIVSVAGMTSVGTGSPYAVSKAALIHLTKYLAVEWANEGIRVNAVAPWYIKTPLTEPVLNDKVKLKSIISRTPMKRIGEPSEVAAVTAFLCMHESSYVTGECIAVDGGFLKNGY